VPLQIARPAGQLTAHLPPLHTWPAAHAVPQVPQLARSLVRSRQLPEQLVSPPPHAVTQSPAAQLWPAEHAVPQAPQLRGSVPSDEQAPPHRV